MAYRARQGIGAEDVSLAVVVQRMVESRAAGVLFTLTRPTDVGIRHPSAPPGDSESPLLAAR